MSRRSVVNAIRRFAPVILIVGSAAFTLRHVLPQPLPPPIAVATADTVAPIRPVRVLLDGDASRLRVRSPGPIHVASEKSESGQTLEAIDWITIESRREGFLSVGGSDFAVAELVLAPAVGSMIHVSLPVSSKAPVSSTSSGTGGWKQPIECPGAIRVRALSGNRLRVVNAVDVERYVAGVVAGEVWPTFARESFRTQAIVARSYVLYQMKLRQRSAYDVVSSPHSQAYVGLRGDAVGRKALQATQYTRGVVCTWLSDTVQELFSCYYCAACGGRTQAARIFAEADDVPPLRGGVRCDHCAIAGEGTYRWKDVRLDSDEVLRRLAVRYPEFASLTDLVAIHSDRTSPSMRPTRIRLKGSDGHSIELGAERFRLAIGSMTMRSTDCDIAVHGDEVSFTGGRGFGHGIGLCQWGMEGLSRQGKQAAEILRFYYPDSQLTRVY